MEISALRKPIRSLLKWAGGKGRLLDRLQRHLPGGVRLVEPFVGSAVVFLNTDYDRYLLADVNPDLIGLYQILKEEKAAFIDYCSSFFTGSNNTPDKYYEYRALFNGTEDRRLRAALFLYLNRHGYNGLCRYNQKGEFNVPFGRYKRPYFPGVEMELFVLKARRAEFVASDFRRLGRHIRAGHHVYCDPPYVPVSATAYFTQYVDRGFGPRCQQDLAEMARRWQQRGAKVVVSNHDNGVTRSLYKHAQIQSFPVQRNISCKGSGRGPVRELIAVYHPRQQDEAELSEKGPA
jgi:DNA adenine methylase